jgi:hypothetical protein
MSEAAEFLRASFTPETGPGAGTSIEVHFNPASLRYDLNTTLAPSGSGDSVKQFVGQARGKLTMELVFDTTDTGEDVRGHTSRIEAFVRVNDQHVPPIVHFDWGSYHFQGIVQTYSETLDFFAPGGVPLRATVSVSLAGQDAIFDPRADGEPAGSDALDVPSFGAGFGASAGFGFSAGFSVGGAAGITAGAGFGVSAGVGFGASAGGGVGFGASAIASAGGNPRAARAIASANAQESVRFSSGASLTVGGGVELRPAAAFSSGASVGFGASAGAGFGASAGAGFGASAGAGFGASAGAGFGASAGAGFGAAAGGGVRIGGAASAGVSASEGAFAGLRPVAAGTSARIDTRRLLKGGATAGLATDRGASFSLGGRAQIVGSGSLGADVSGGGLRGRIRFDAR